MVEFYDVKLTRNEGIKVDVAAVGNWTGHVRQRSDSRMLTI